MAPPHIKRRKVSKVWEIFDKVKREDGTEWATCKYCKKEYTGSSKKAGTSNLLKHMGKCPGRRNGDGDKPDCETGSTATSVINSEKSVHGQESCSVSLTKMMIKRKYPTSVVENDFSQNFENNLLPKFKLQSYGNSEANMLDVYKEEKERLLTSFNKPSSRRFNLTVNCWRLDEITTYCCLTLHFIDDGWELTNKVLAFRRVRLCDSYWKLFGAFKSMLLDWSNISKNVCMITAQKTEEIDMIVNEIKSWLLHRDSLPFSGKLSHVNCFVHILNLLFEDGLQEVQDVIFDIKKCIHYVHDTPQNERKFRCAIEQARDQGMKVTSEDMPESWTSYSFEILEKVLGLREAFNILKILDQNFVSLNPRNEEWNKATLVYELLKVLDEALRSFSGSRSCLTTNVYFPRVCNIYRSLSELVKSDNFGIRSMACKMKEKFINYWENCILVLAIAVVLDPRFKCDIVEHWFKEIFGQHADKHCERIQDILKQVYNEYASGSKNSTNHFDMLDHLGMPCTSSKDAEDGKSQKTELERYLEEPKFRSVQDFDILGWWRVNTPNFPTLAKMARDFLAIPISAAQSNPSFNDNVLKIDPASIDQDPEVIEAFICSKDWLQVPERKDCSINVEHAPFK